LLPSPILGVGTGVRARFMPFTNQLGSLCHPQQRMRHFWIHHWVIASNLWKSSSVLRAVSHCLVTVWSLSGHCLTRSLRIRISKIFSVADVLLLIFYTLINHDRFNSDLKSIGSQIFVIAWKTFINWCFT
jgi:hypothetical protein